MSVDNLTGEEFRFMDEVPLDLNRAKKTSSEKLRLVVELREMRESGMTCKEIVDLLDGPGLRTVEGWLQDRYLPRSWVCRWALDRLRRRASAILSEKDC